MLVTSAAIMLVAALTIWLLLLLIAVAFAARRPARTGGRRRGFATPSRSDGMEVGGGGWREVGQGHDPAVP